MDTIGATLFENEGFLESPRWYGGQLWMSDVLGEKVLCVDGGGSIRTVCQLQDLPSGIGFLPDGRLLIVTMKARRLLSCSAGSVAPYLDLRDLNAGTPNDMAIDESGRAYVGDLGFDLFERHARGSDGRLMLVRNCRDASVVADELAYPNGIALTSAGDTLIVAETDADRLTAFTIRGDGSLTRRRVFAQLPAGSSPDGLCLDQEGAAWVAAFNGERFLRVKSGGQVIQCLRTPGQRAVACVLGGVSRRSLYCLMARTSPEDLRRGESQSRLEVVDVTVPGAGIP
ncbi:MAG: SMP-30/gluconolactonase/LRE family protein [Deltaproteobacteria bacterium]|nr:SMP-30/gluconolactonase/LRE family protein [Deltaproteobacteria bacterium]